MKPVLLLFIVMTLLLTAACADDQEETPSAAQVPANATARLAPTPTPTTTPEPTGEASPSPTPSLTLTAPATATPTPIPTQARAPLPPAPVPARDTSTHSRPAQSIVDSIVHVVGDGGSATGIIVDERGYVITSRHITDAILNVDVWLPGGRLVGGTARYRDQETGLVLVELKRADLLDLKPIELEPLVRSTGPGEAIFVVSLAAREVMPAETRLEVGYGISDLAGNEWFRLDSKLPMTSVGGPVLSERFGQIIGILVLKEIAGEVDNFVLKLESLERIQSTTLSRRGRGYIRPCVNRSSEGVGCD